MGGSQVSRYVISVNAKAVTGKERPVMQAVKLDCIYHFLFLYVSEYNSERTWRLELDGRNTKAVWRLSVLHCMCKFVIIRHQRCQELIVLQGFQIYSMRTKIHIPSRVTWQIKKNWMWKSMGTDLYTMGMDSQSVHIVL